MLDPRHKLYRWGPISACPLFMYFAIETAFAPLKKFFGITYTESLIIFKDNKVTWLLDDKELGKQSEKFVNDVILNDTKSKKYFSLWNTRTKELSKSFVELSSLRFTTVADKVLVSGFEEFSRIYYNWFIITISIELVASNLEPLLGAQIKQYFNDSNKVGFQKAFSTLTAPLALTFYRQEQKDLLTILTLPKEKRDQALTSHQKKYYWILNSYAQAKELDRDYFKNELKKYEKDHYKKILDEIKKYPAFIRKNKRLIINNLKPNNNDKKLISLVETFSQLLDERKAMNFRSEHYLELFAQEFARRRDMSVDDLKYLLPGELAKVLTHVNYPVIASRRDCFVLHCTDKNINHYTGQNAQTLANQFLRLTNINESMIHGQVASVGESYYFRGTARIVLSIDEIDKVQEGDILIATMTSPDFVIGMKRAGAIVTDTGGMLSHAAIVSREFKKPCIVGTEIATKVIRDGDIVELHCGRGTVKIIKHTI